MTFPVNISLYKIKNIILMSDESAYFTKIAPHSAIITIVQALFRDEYHVSNRTYLGAR